MNFLNLTEELEKHVAALCDHSLLSKGLAALNSVNTVVRAINESKITKVQAAEQVAEQVIETVAPEVTPVIEEVKKVVRKYKKK
jgi:hypothetical protein